MYACMRLSAHMHACMGLIAHCNNENTCGRSGQTRRPLATSTRRQAPLNVKSTTAQRRGLYTPVLCRLRVGGSRLGRVAGHVHVTDCGSLLCGRSMCVLVVHVLLPSSGHAALSCTLGEVGSMRTPGWRRTMSAVLAGFFLS